MQVSSACSCYDITPTFSDETKISFHLRKSYHDVIASGAPYLQIKMVTGDQLAIGVETSRRLGMGTRFMEGKDLMHGEITDAELGQKILELDGFAGVYPEHKHRIVQAMQAKGMLIGMTGGLATNQSKAYSTWIVSL